MTSPIPEPAGRPRRRRRGANGFALTETQREVAECVGKGWSSARIAEWLGMHVDTVRSHVKDISRKIPPYGDLRGRCKVLAWVLTRRAA
jgi:DNA-binding CsgD family transcriptional regulator